MSALSDGARLRDRPRAPPPDVPAAEVERRFPGYEVLAQIGRGGMGVVFRARQKALDRDVALKVLPGGPTRGAEFVQRFQREAKALARLQHPGIVQIFDFGASDDGWCFLAMELVLGVNLRRVLADRRIAPKEALAIVPQICDALQYAHDQGVVHRDIKPENVLLTKDGKVKLADFGLAKLMEGARGPSLTASGHVMGTPHYMAPEQVEHPADVDHRADIYSLGVVFYEMLTGELPLGRFAPPSGKCDVSARIDDIVLRTLEKERDARFQRVAEVKTGIDAAGAAPPPIPAARGSAWGGLFAPRPEGARTSRLALLCVPAGLSAAFVALVEENSAASQLTIALPVIAAAAWLCVYAWGRVRHSEGRLHGVGFAATGLFGCFVAAALAVALSVRATQRQFEDERRTQRWDMERRREQVSRPPRVVEGVEIPAEYDDSIVPQYVQAPRIAALARRLQAVHPTTRPDVLSGFYAPSDAEALQTMFTDVREAKAKQGALGLPMITSETLGAPLSDFGVGTIVVNGDHGTVTLEHATRRTRLVAHVERQTSNVPPGGVRPWVFSLAPVVQSRIEDDDPSSPR